MNFYYLLAQPTLKMKILEMGKAIVLQKEELNIPVKPVISEPVTCIGVVGDGKREREYDGREK